MQTPPAPARDLPRPAAVLRSGGMGGDLPHLRLVWSRPATPAPPRVNLAQAIERHLAGQDGLSDDQFLLLYATGLAHRRDTLHRVSPLRAVARPCEVG